MSSLIGSNSMNPFGGGSGGGGGSTALEQVNRSTSKERRFNTTVDKVIPAGWFYFDLINQGLNSINVNGEQVQPGGQWNGEEKIDWKLRRQELGIEINLVTNGELVSVHVAYPNSSLIDVATI